MSSHWEWQERVVAQHDLEKPFAPENGAPLKFKIGDPVIFTNPNGVTFRNRVTGYYLPEGPCSLYACGRRYLLDSSSPWFPVKETELELDKGARDEVSGPIGVDQVAVETDCPTMPATS